MAFLMTRPQFQNHLQLIEYLQQQNLKEQQMTFLQHLGSTLKKILGIATQVAADAEPIIDIAFPAIAPLYNTTVGLATGAEALAPTTTGTGAQKLSQLMAGLLPMAQSWAKTNGINWPEAEIQKWASAVVDTVNLIPAPASATVTPTSTGTTSTVAATVVA